MTSNLVKFNRNFSSTSRKATATGSLATAISVSAAAFFGLTSITSIIVAVLGGTGLVLINYPIIAQLLSDPSNFIPSQEILYQLIAEFARLTASIESELGRILPGIVQIISEIDMASVEYGDLLDLYDNLRYLDSYTIPDLSRQILELIEKLDNTDHNTFCVDLRDIDRRLTESSEQINRILRDLEHILRSKNPEFFPSNNYYKPY